MKSAILTCSVTLPNMGTLKGILSEEKHEILICIVKNFLCVLMFFRFGRQLILPFM